MFGGELNTGSDTNFVELADVEIPVQNIRQMFRRIVKI
jgi:hypothetical protein